MNEIRDTPASIRTKYVLSEINRCWVLRCTLSQNCFGANVHNDNTVPILVTLVLEFMSLLVSQII
jgi:hypothetical protein